MFKWILFITVSLLALIWWAVLMVKQDEKIKKESQRAFDYMPSKRRKFRW